MSAIFQNVAQLKNRYPDDAWLEIIGNCDTQLFLGCTDEMTAIFASDRTGEATIGVESTAKEMQSMRLSNYVPSQREVTSIGRRKLLTPDEVLRLPREDALVILRGQKVLKVKKFDYTRHPEFKKLREYSARNYIPSWRLKDERSKPSDERLSDTDADDLAVSMQSVKAHKRKRSEPGRVSAPTAVQTPKSVSKKDKPDANAEEKKIQEEADINKNNEPFEAVDIDDLLSDF